MQFIEVNPNYNQNPGKGNTQNWRIELESSVIVILTSNNWIRELSECNSY